MWGHICRKRERSENNGCREARVIFAELSLLRQVRLSTNAVNNKKKKAVSDFQHWEDIHCDTLPDGILKITIYLIWACWIQNRTTYQSNNRHFEIET